MTDFDPDKPVRTRDGREARIICKDRKGRDGSGLVVLVTQSNGFEEAWLYNPDGHIYPPTRDHRDLVNVPERKMAYCRVYAHGRIGAAVYDDLFNARLIQAGALTPLAILEMVEEDGKPVSVRLLSKD